MKTTLPARTPILLFVAAFAIAGSVAAHAQEFLAYEGKKAIREGDGGAKKIVDGIEFWSEGEPPRRFQILGYIKDSRHKSGIIGKISMSNLETDIASVAKQHGGDAVILTQSDAETVGSVGFANATSNGNSAFGIGMARPVQKQNTRFAVVRYVAEGSATGATQLPMASEPVHPAQDATKTR